MRDGMLLEGAYDGLIRQSGNARYSPCAICVCSSTARRGGLPGSVRSEIQGVMRKFSSLNRSRSRTRRSAANPHGIVIVDDLFPNLITGFRVAEFSWLLRAGVVREVMTSLAQLEDHLPSFLELYPDLEGRVGPYAPDRLPEFELAYVVFLDNARILLPDFARHHLDFVMELYPGGGLRLGTAETARTLHDVVTSPRLRGILTTQPRVTEYLAAIGPKLPPVEEVLGVVVNESYFGPEEGFGRAHPYFGLGKGHLDVLFAAHRYDERGVHKGYPVFIEVCRLLSEAGVPLRAHVVGGHRADDVRLGDLDQRFTFHGPLVTDQFQRMALGMDLVLSPNQPSLVRPGAWDGFPTGSCVEAALCGVGVVCSDELDQNRLFTDGEDILISPPDPELYCARILDLLQRADGVANLAESGRRSFRQAYSTEAQLVPRKNLLVAALGAVRDD